MRFSPLALALSLFCFTAAAHADTYTTFAFNGYYAYTEATSTGPGPVLGNYDISGTITYDHTTASITSVDGFNIYYPFSNSSSGPVTDWQSYHGPYLSSIEAYYLHTTPILGLTIPSEELDSGLGGEICSEFGDCYTGTGYSSLPSDIRWNSRSTATLYGTLTPQSSNPAPTPEPASITLLLTGLAGSASIIRRRRLQR